MARTINQHRDGDDWCRWSDTEVSGTCRYSECPDGHKGSQVLAPAGEIRTGDTVDLLSLPYPISDSAAVAAEFAFAEVAYVERERPDCVVLHTDNGSYGLDPETRLVLGPHVRRP